MDKNTLLTGFVVDRLRVGIPQSEVKQNLIAVGWTDDAADEAIMEGLLTLGAPTPKMGTRTMARKSSSTLDVVLNFFSFILLAIVATALGVLYYQIINKWFPDPLVARYGYGSGSFSTMSAQYAIAALIVAFPCYVLVVKMWFKRFREGAERAESKLTKWLTYLVLLVTSVTIIGDLITAIFYFLQGELTARFFLKALTILVIAGTIFGFYVLERRLVQYGQDIPRRVFQNFGWAITAFVGVGVVLGFLASGSPKTERMRTFDSQRSNDLAQLAGCINNFAFERKRLPDSIADLESSSNYQYCASQVTDPETGEAYSYRIVEGTAASSVIREARYELCATFAFTSTKDNLNERGANYAYPLDNKWGVHEAGRSCDIETAVIERDVVPPPTLQQKT